MNPLHKTKCSVQTLFRMLFCAAFLRGLSLCLRLAPAATAGGELRGASAGPKSGNGIFDIAA